MSYLKPQDLKLGDKFYECEYGVNMEFEVVEAPVSEQTEILDTTHLQWRWKGKRKDGEIVEFLLTEGYGHYGPKIYSSPMYLKRVNNELVYEVI